MLLASDRREDGEYIEDIELKTMTWIIVLHVQFRHCRHHLKAFAKKPQLAQPPRVRQDAFPPGMPQSKGLERLSKDA